MNIIDQIWDNKCQYSNEKVNIHEAQYAGATCKQKYGRVKETLKKMGIKDESIALVVVRLDNIACK
jgi:hypothetical protein